MMAQAVSDAKIAYGKATDWEGHKLVIARIDADMNQMRNVASALKDIDAEVIAVMGGVFEDKPALCVMLPQSLVDAKKLDASAMVRDAAKEIQGGGGGQKTLATAGGKNAAGIEKAIEILRKNF